MEGTANWCVSAKSSSSSVSGTAGKEMEVGTEMEVDDGTACDKDECDCIVAVVECICDGAVVGEWMDVVAELTAVAGDVSGSIDGPRDSIAWRGIGWQQAKASTPMKKIDLVRLRE